MSVSAALRARPSLVGAAALLVIIDLPLGDWLFKGHSLVSRAAGEGLFWLLTAAILVYVACIERRPLSSIGLVTPTWKSFVFGAGAAVLMIAAMALIYTVIYPAFGARADVGSGTAVSVLPKWFLFCVVVRAAVFEEIFYRGFAIERISEMTGQRAIAATVSIAAFTFAHLSGWGWMHLIVAATGGVVLTALYLWRRDLISNMVAHFLTDAVGLLLG